MARGFRTNLKTSSAPQHPPFKVEVVNGRDILCHVGRVYDYLSSKEYGQNLQKSWDATQSKITGKGLPNTRANKVELKYFDYDVITGSAKIHFKGTATTAAQGRATATTAVHTVGENGYVKFLRSNSPADNYLILHRVYTSTAPDAAKWCISAVEDIQVDKGDIVLAYIANNTTVRQVWKSDVVVSSPVIVDDCTHPFQIKVNKDTGEYTVAGGVVGVGTVTPMSGTATAKTYFNLTATEGSAGFEYTAGGGSIAAEATPPSGGANALKFCIGYVDGTSATSTASGTWDAVQYLTSSLWLEIFRCGTGSKEYYWNSI